MTSQPQTDLTYVAVSTIRVAPEFNPRRTFSDKETSEFAQRINSSGWVSPLLVRPDPAGEGYLLVAGERRFRAVIHLGWEHVPVTIKQMDDVEHRKLALAENADRKDLTVAEEALAAREHVDAYGGDHERAADSLGWPVKRLKHRLQLLHATPEVMEALLHERIQLGHAELLATLPHENQAKALPRILEKSLSVADLREQLNGFATPLAQAIFPLDQCQSCPFNSEFQRGLFAEHINGGLCTNKPCFATKTEEALQAKRVELKNDFGTVVLLSEKVPGTTVPLVKLGETGVGEEQFNACRTCEHRGCIVIDTPGKSLGQVSGPNCFNLACHSQMNATYREMLNPTPSTPDDSGDDAEEGQGDTQSPQGTSAGGTAKKPTSAAAKAKGKKPAPKAKTKATMKAVVDQYADAIRKAAIVTVQQDATIPLAMSAYAMLRVVADECPHEGFASTCKKVGLKYVEGSDSSKRNASQVVLELCGKSEEELRELILQLTTMIFDTKPNDTSFQGKLNRRGLAANISATAGVDLVSFIRVDKEFLSAHTRAAIESVLEESGFKAWCEAQDEGKKRYSAIVGKGKDDMVEAILAAGFDFAGYEPSGFAQERKGWEQFKRL